MNPSVTIQQRYCIHDFELSLGIAVINLINPLDDLLCEFAVKQFAGRSVAPLAGIIRPFEQREVLRHLSPTAKKVTADNSPLELFEENERCWRIDDHWGICEINLLKGQWRSWIMPSPLADPATVVEQAILWPLSQLLRPRGLCVIPSASVVRDGRGTLIISPFSSEPELEALLRAGYGVVGQSWTALREQSGRVSLLSMPGWVHRTNDGRVDLTREFCGSARGMAECDSVLLVAPGRRPVAHLQHIASSAALAELRRAWPMPELRMHRRSTQLLSLMTQRCGLFEAHLSRNPADILHLLDIVRLQSPARLSLSLHLPRPKRRLVA